MRPSDHFRPLAALGGALACLAALAAPAAAAIVELKDGTTLESDRLHYTYTHLVVITPNNDMRLVPNDQVKSVDGQTFTRAYWDSRPGHEDSGGAGAHGSTYGATGAGMVIDRLMPLKVGTFRRYDLEQVRTTWVRHGVTMERRETIEADGEVRENITGPTDGTGAMNLLEIIREKTPNRPSHTVTLRHRIEGRPDGYYLVGGSMEDANLAPQLQTDTISSPPRLWPQDLSVGQTWIVGPFQRMGLGQVARMEVVGVEAITTPAGAYPEAFKVVGHGSVFGGALQLKNGRLVTDHGTIETTTWVVPGVGPVRELSKVHLHQGFFPFKGAKQEIPIVVEEEATRTLAEFHAGQ